MTNYERLIERVSALATAIGNAIQLRGFKTGGTTGQVPTKTSSTDFEWSWTTPDHGALNGLSDDDHPQYLNNARGDLRYDALGLAEAAKARSTHTGTQSISTLTGTIAQLSAAVTDQDVASVGGVETLFNKTLNLPTLIGPALGTPTSGNLQNCTNLPVTAVSGTIAQFNTALTDADFATIAGTNILTNKVINSFTNTIEADALHVQVRNSTGATLLKGSPVYISGFNAGQLLPEVALADASVVGTMPAIGLIENDLPNNTNGEVDRVGILTNVNTSAWTQGALLYVSETTGTLTNTPPVGAALVQPIATVLRSHASNGVLEVNDRGVTDITAAQAAATYLSIALITSAASTLTLSSATSYIFTGTTSTWTLPSPTGNSGMIRFLKNRGTGDITLNGSIYSTAILSTLTLASGQGITLVCDGTYFNLV